MTSNAEVIAPMVSFMALIINRYEAYHPHMSGIPPECPNSSPSNLSIAANLLVRQEPDAEEDEEDDGDHKENENDDDDDDEGYSE